MLHTMRPNKPQPSRTLPVCLSIAVVVSACATGDEAEEPPGTADGATASVDSSAGGGDADGKPDGVGSAGGAGGGALLPDVTEEICDGLDNDQNGIIDEGCTCTPGETQACWPGSAATRGVGGCRDGSRTCVQGGEFGTWGECLGAQLPVEETCANGVDDDCNGAADCDDTACTPTPGECSPTPSACATAIWLQSDAATLSASIGWGMAAADVARLNTADTSGLSFEPAAVGTFGANIPVPPGAPGGTQVINIAPGNGYNGYFKVTFTLPSSLSDLSAITMSGAAIVDDYGRAFLNGTPITPAIEPGVGNGALTEFCVTDPGLFVPGTNEFLLSDANTGAGHPTDAGPSGAAFYAVVTYSSG